MYSLAGPGRAAAIEAEVVDFEALIVIDTCTKAGALVALGADGALHSRAGIGGAAPVVTIMVFIALEIICALGKTGPFVAAPAQLTLHAEAGIDGASSVITKMIDFDALVVVDTGAKTAALVTGRARRALYTRTGIG